MKYRIKRIKICAEKQVLYIYRRKDGAYKVTRPFHAVTYYPSTNIEWFYRKYINNVLPFFVV